VLSSASFSSCHSPSLLADAAAELDRLQLQARVWEPAGRDLLAGVSLPGDARVLDVGCGALGWLRVLADRFTAGEVVGTDIDEGLLAAAAAATAVLPNVRLVRDDLFDTALEDGSFDLVHARFQLAPLGRFERQLDTYMRLLRPGGVLIVEDPDSRGWGVSPDAPATEELMRLVRDAFALAGGDFDAGRRLPGLLAGAGLEPYTTARIVTLEPGHPYLRMPLQFARSLEPCLVELAGADEVLRLREEAEAELSHPGRWGTTFTLVQARARVP
jgi:SAM-dependent methyltransferase